MIGAVKVRDDLSLIRTVNYTHTAATIKDTVYLLNSLPMLAINSADANAANIYLISGLIEYAKTSAQAWTAGVKLYWDDTAKEFTTASTGNTLAGIAAETAANPSSTGLILLNPFLVGTNALEHAMTDPGDAGAIPVTASGVCAITTAGSETRTMAIPTVIGQEIVLVIDTDGGTCVITSAQAVNQAGNNTITMAEAADMIKLTAVTIGDALRWRVTANDGAALSTV